MKQCPSCLSVYSEGELCTLDGTSLVQCDICEATESAEDEPGNEQLAGEILDEIYIFTYYQQQTAIIAITIIKRDCFYTSTNMHSDYITLRL